MPVFSTTAVLALAALAAVALVLFLTVPRSTTVAAGQLRIESPLRTWTYPVAEIASAEAASLHSLRTLRLFAVGWPFPPVGWLWDKANGRFPALASSRKNLYMLRFRNGSRLLVSLANAEALKPALR